MRSWRQNGVQKVEFERIRVSFQAFSAVVIQEILVFVTLETLWIQRARSYFQWYKTIQLCAFFYSEARITSRETFSVTYRKKVSPVPRTHFDCYFFVWNTLSEGPRAGTNFARNCFVIFLRGGEGVSESTQKSFCFGKPILEESYLARPWGGTSPFIACI